MNRPHYSSYFSEMNHSYWEYKTWLSNVDYTIVGSGIVGLNAAMCLATKFPKAKVLVLERGILPQGASTKNAGFACFGSISEVLSDLEDHSEQEVFDLVKRRYNGIGLLRKNLGDNVLDYKLFGGHELFLNSQQELYDSCHEKMQEINELLNPIFKGNAFCQKPNDFCFKGINDHFITNIFEGQLDTGKMMASLLEEVQKKGVRILNAVSVEDFEDKAGDVLVKTKQFEFRTKKLLIATNGFAKDLVGEAVQPARAQVLVTKPIENLKIKGTFHFEEGYYYFRDVDNRILFGGGRNLDFDAEETSKFGQTALVQNELKRLLKEVILPDTIVEIERSWSGIMGVGNKKRPIVKQLSNNVYCGVRLGGMGIAIGSAVGSELAELL